MSAPDVWIESKRISLKSALLVGWFGGIAFASVAAVLAVLVVAAPSVFDFRLDSVGWFAMLLVPVAAGVAFLARTLFADGAGTIGVSGGDLVIVQGAKKKQIPLADLASGRANPGRGEVDIRLRGGARIVAAVPQAEDAERLLVAAGLDVSKRTMRFELGETTFLDWMTFLLGPALVLPLTQAIVGLAPMPWIVGVVVFFGLFALLFALVRAAFGPVALIVGADGIVVDRPLRDRFVPFGRLASVTMKHSAVDLVLTNGSRVRARARHLDAVQQAALRARIDAATATFRHGESDAEALSRLDRGGRAIADWRAALRTPLDQQGSYRAMPLTREQLLAVLESPAASAERRLAAAVSLSAAGEAQIATRIRVAAEACARPRVRIALAGVAEGEIDDGAIEEAIAEDERARA